MKQSRELFLIPRVIQLKDAPTYLGMDKTTFNREIRPYLETIKITEGKSRGFEKKNIDEVFDHYKIGKTVPPH